MPVMANNVPGGAGPWHALGLPLACLPNLRELNKPANKKARQLNKVPGLKINVQMNL
jgi:hypothetical protein